MTLIREKAAGQPAQGMAGRPRRHPPQSVAISPSGCILAERDGSLWAANSRGGVMHIRPDGSQQLITRRQRRARARKDLVDGTLPNGLAFARNGDILVANFGTDALEIMTRDGASRTLYDSIDGKPLGKVNFVLRDRKDRLWITVSTKINPWPDAIRVNYQADGYIAVIDDKASRVVDRWVLFHQRNPLRRRTRNGSMSPRPARAASRACTSADDSWMSEREIYGPRSLGSGLIDGIAINSYGNLWATIIFADRLVAITPTGDLLTLVRSGDREASKRFDAEFDRGHADRKEG